MNPRSRVTALVLSLCLALISAAHAEAPPKRLAEGSQGLNLLLGDWTVQARIRNSPISYLEGAGTMKVTWDAAGKTLLAEMKVAFDGFAVNGTTRRVYDPKREEWQVGWHPTEPGQSEVLNIEGRLRDDRFVEIDYGTDGYGSYLGRLVIEVLDPNRLSVRKDRLYDDGTLLPETWSYEATRVTPVARE
ncbi:MAG: hypothetical protein K8J08_19105 [Thermoanaerobaculia bacterium]|nr:hypothetical protein [Thermoanaerobaculia bacterium]